MEIGFMGYSPDEVIDAAPVRSLAMQWSYPNKAASSLPQLVSFRGPRPEDTPRTGFDSLASTGLVKITTSGSYETDRQYIDLTGLPAARQSFVAGQNRIGCVSPQPISVVKPVTVLPSTSPVVGTTDLRNDTKVSGAPAQLTIFYNGSVCVYDNVSPEKAQAIMLLAGNGPTNIAPSTTIPTAPVQTMPTAPVQAAMPPLPRSSFLDSFMATQPLMPTVLSSSPSPVASIRVVPQSVGFSSTSNDATVSKLGDFLLSSNKVERLKAVNMRATSGTVPQFRRKSLARFLEKRKDRVINVSPFGNMQSSDSSSNPEAGNSILTVNSSSLRPMPTIDQWNG